MCRQWLGHIRSDGLPTLWRAATVGAAGGLAGALAVKLGTISSAQLYWIGAGGTLLLGATNYLLSLKEGDPHDLSAIRGLSLAAGATATGLGLTLALT